MEEEVLSLAAKVRVAEEARDIEVALRVTAEGALAKMAGELEGIRDRPRANASCGCPEMPHDRQVAMVELEEYLITYLSKVIHTHLHTHTHTHCLG